MLCAARTERTDRSTHRGIARSMPSRQCGRVRRQRRGVAGVVGRGRAGRRHPRAPSWLLAERRVDTPCAHPGVVGVRGHRLPLRLRRPVVALPAHARGRRPAAPGRRRRRAAPAQRRRVRGDGRRRRPGAPVPGRAGRQGAPGRPPRASTTSPSPRGRRSVPPGVVSELSPRGGEAERGVEVARAQALEVEGDVAVPGGTHRRHDVVAAGHRRRPGGRAAPRSAPCRRSGAPARPRTRGRAARPRPARRRAAGRASPACRRAGGRRGRPRPACPTSAGRGAATTPARRPW